MIGHSSKGMATDTCNGQVRTNETVGLQADELQEQIKPYLLDSTPDVLSIGRRCVKYGYGFQWDPFSVRPFFVNPAGDKIPMEVLDYVPYLADHCNKSNAPELNNGTGCPALPASSFRSERQKVQAEEQAVFVDSKRSPNDAEQKQPKKAQALWESLEKELHAYKTKGTKARTNLGSKDAPRDATGRYLQERIPSDQVTEGPIFDCRRLLAPRFRFNVVPVKKANPINNVSSTWTS